MSINISSRYIIDIYNNDSSQYVSIGNAKNVKITILNNNSVKNDVNSRSWREFNDGSNSQSLSVEVSGYILNLGVESYIYNCVFNNLSNRYKIQLLSDNTIEGNFVVSRFDSDSSSTRDMVNFNLLLSSDGIVNYT